MKKFLVNIVLILIASSSLFSQEVGDTLWSYNFNNDGVNVNGAIFTPDGQYVLAHGGAWLYKFDLSGKLVSHILSPTGIWPIKQFSIDGKYFWDQLLNKYDAITCKKIDSLKNHNPKSKIYKWVINEELNIGLIVHGFEAHSLKDKHFEIFDPKTMTVTQLIQNPDSTARMWDIDISSDGRYIALSMDRAVADGVNERVVSNRVEVWDAKELKPIKVLIENNIPDIKLVGFSKNNKYFIICLTNMFIIYNTEFNKILDWNFEGMRSFLFSEDTNYLIVGGRYIYKINLNNKQLEKYWFNPTEPKFIVDNRQNELILSSHFIGDRLIVLNDKITDFDETNFKQEIALKNEIIFDKLEIIFGFPFNKSVKYSITDINGIVVINSEFVSFGNGTNIIIQLPKIPKGIYFFNTAINGQNYHLKFIKE